MVVVETPMLSLAQPFTSRQATSRRDLLIKKDPR
jgi:hypothetical protein